MRRKLLEIEPGPLLDIVPIHSDEIVTFAAREKWKKTRRVKVGRRKENLFVHQHRKGRKISETWGDYRWWIINLSSPLIRGEISTENWETQPVAKFIDEKGENFTFHCRSRGDSARMHHCTRLVLVAKQKILSFPVTCAGGRDGNWGVMLSCQEVKLLKGQSGLLML